jgi:acetylornithine deacetylase
VEYHGKAEFGLGFMGKREVAARLAAVCRANPSLCEHPIRVDRILDADRAEVSDYPFVCVLARLVLSGFGAHSEMGLPTGLGRTPTVNFSSGDPAQSNQPNECVAVIG